MSGGQSRSGLVVRVPGDKSISHRALMFAALAPGTSRIVGGLTSLDVRATARVLRALGADISPLRPGSAIRVTGRRHWRSPTAVLDCGNSGTTARLLLGLLAGQRISASLSGDRSLRRRPMARVTDPLIAMGARVEGNPDRLPLRLHGGTLRSITWHSPVASAQVKSAVLLAAAVARIPVTIHEPAASRDHTERLLHRFGFRVDRSPGTLHFEPTGSVVPGDFQVPGDPSSAVFLLAAAGLLGREDCRVVEVGCNPGRIGWVAVLERMGWRIDMTDRHDQGGEPVATLAVRPGPLRATTVRAAEVPALIDEVPMLACLAARADGVSRFEGLAELRVKESDRLELLAANLRAVGGSADVDGDALVVSGSDSQLAGRVVTRGDHRIAMAFAVLGRSTGDRIAIDDPDCAAVSFPGFAEQLATVAGANR